MYYAKNVRGALLIGCLYRGTQKPKIKISVAAKVSFPTPRGGRGWIVPIMAYTGRLRPKGVAFSVLRYMGVGISLVRSAKGLKWLTDAFNGCEKDKLTWFSDLFIFTKKGAFTAA